MVFADRDLGRVTQHEALPLGQKTGIAVGERLLAFSALPQLAQLFAHPLPLRCTHLFPRLPVRILVQFLHPLPNFILQLA